MTVPDISVPCVLYATMLRGKT